MNTGIEEYALNIKNTRIYEYKKGDIPEYIKIRIDVYISIKLLFIIFKCMDSNRHIFAYMKISEFM